MCLAKGKKVKVGVKNLSVNSSLTKSGRARPSLKMILRPSCLAMVLGEDVLLLPFVELDDRVDVKEDVGAESEGFSGAAWGSFEIWTGEPC